MSLFFPPVRLAFSLLKARSEPKSANIAIFKLTKELYTLAKIGVDN